MYSELSGDEKTNIVVNLEILSDKIPECSQGVKGAIILKRDSSNRINFKISNFITGVGLDNVGLASVPIILGANKEISTLFFLIAALREFGDYRKYTDDETLVLWSLISNGYTDGGKPTISKKILIEKLCQHFEKEYAEAIISMFLEHRVFCIKYDKGEEIIFIKEKIIQL